MDHEQPVVKMDRRRPGLLVLSMLVLLIALFITPQLLRGICIHLNKTSYVPDQFEIEHYSEGGDATSFGGRVVSSSERYVGENVRIVEGGLDFVRKLAAEGRVQGFRSPILYISQRSGAWATLDLVLPFRIIRRDELDLNWLGGWAAITAGFWVMGIFLLRKAVCGKN